MKMGLHTHHHPLKLNFHQEQHHIKHIMLHKQNLNIKDIVNSINNIDSNNSTTLLGVTDTWMKSVFAQLALVFPAILGFWSDFWRLWTKFS